MKSERYFQNPEMRREALDSYARFSSKKAQVLLDADLAIPGSSEPVYQSYARADSPGIRLGAGSRVPPGQDDESWRTS